MPSPFPGMDPYLESPGVWPAFHARFVHALCESLTDRLPPGYDADLDERIRLVVPHDGPTSERLPDIGVTRDSDAPAVPVATAVAVLEAVALPDMIEERVRVIRVLHGRERDLVTDIELLSPTNKSGAGLREYENKRSELIGGGVHVVEINLLLGGRRPAIGSPWPAGDYYTLVFRSDWPRRAGVRSWPLRDPLPTIPIPLRAPDPDVLLDLTPVFATAYERGRYARRLDYAVVLPTPLSPDDRAWAESRARNALTSS